MEVDPEAHRPPPVAGASASWLRLLGDVKLAGDRAGVAALDLADAVIAAFARAPAPVQVADRFTGLVREYATVRADDQALRRRAQGEGDAVAIVNELIVVHKRYSDIIERATAFQDELRQLV